VTWDGRGEGIGLERAPHRPGGVRMTDPLGDPPVCPHFSPRYLIACCPDFLVEQGILLHVGQNLRRDLLHGFPSSFNNRLFLRDR